MYRLRNKKRLKPTKLDELCDALSSELKAAKVSLQGGSEDERVIGVEIGWHDAIAYVLKLARTKQREQR